MKQIFSIAFRVFFVINVLLVHDTLQAQAPPPTAAPSSDSTQELKGLIGKWYLGGDITKVCYVAASENTYFAINEINIPYILTKAQNNILVLKSPEATVAAVILPGYILGIGGWWWSRVPIVSGDLGRN